MSEPMKAIVVRQPWATLIALGIKTIETRPGPPNGPMRPDGVRGLPGLALERGERRARIALRHSGIERYRYFRDHIGAGHGAAGALDLHVLDKDAICEWAGRSHLCWNDLDPFNGLCVEVQRLGFQRVLAGGIFLCQQRAIFIFKALV